MKDTIKKNILDLNYNKCLQYKITSIIILLMYLFGIIIRILTKQILLTNIRILAFILITSGVIIISCIYTIYISNKHLR